ncbi:MAG: chemotaxis protein CheW [Azoarcus sp.]|jgi:twitching motility protein PilI|nr:chemotaxis protein CheW [Azoarcus sp.]
MSKRISLREFQENLARRLATAHASEHRGLLGVQAGDENWLLSLPDAGEIISMTSLAPVSLAREWYRGLVNVRGVLYSVVDLSNFHDGPIISPSAQVRLLLIGARQNVHSAIMVSRVLGLHNDEDFDVDPSFRGTDSKPWVDARLFDTQNRPWLRLNVPRLLSSSTFLDAGIG